MANMAQIEVAMFESVTAKTKTSATIMKHERPRRECRSRKRPYDLEPYCPKRAKYDQLDGDEPTEAPCAFGVGSDTDDEIDSESKYSTSDETDPASQRQADDNSDLEEVDEDTSNPNFGKVVSDQHRHIPVVLKQTLIQQQQALTRHSKRLIGQFKYLYNHSIRKPVQPTLCPENLQPTTQEIYLEKLRWELKNTFNRIDLFKEGYCVLSNEPFSFHSLCYMCGSMGSDLIYCNSCCEAYHPCCLNDYERPRLNPPPDSWLCPNCNVCTICGLLTPGNVLSRLNNEPNFSSQMVSCFDCQRNFHLKCLKRFKDEQLMEITNIINTTNATNSSIVSLSRLTNSYFLNQTWSCPSCIKCDCGQEIISNERNLLSLGKTLLSQQSLMCTDCLTNLKFLRVHKNDQIDKCHFCEKYIEQILIKSQNNSLLQCSKCQHRFHPKCDGYISEDALFLPQMNHLASTMICSKCDLEQRDKTQKHLLDYKLQAMQTTLIKVSSILERMSMTEEHRANVQSDLANLQQLHESRRPSFNLHAFLNDLLLLIRRLFINHDLSRWQSAIDGCILCQCPWFKSPSFLSNHSSPLPQRSLQPSPSTDHSYAFSSLSCHNEGHRKKSHFLSTTDSLLRYLTEKRNDPQDQFTNLHRTDQRKCQLCEMMSDQNTSNIGRLISFGINQWVHVGCILPAYAKNLDQPPYILRNIRETVIRCQTKYVCALCSRLGASVHCHEHECYQRFHFECIQKYYSAVEKNLQQQLNITNGFLPNLTTLCLRHNGLKASSKLHRDSADTTNDDQAKENTNSNGPNAPKIKSVHTSSTVYGDLSSNSVEFAIVDTRLCIGSLQIDALGDFDYLLDPPEHPLSTHTTYPNNYRASRLFWSTRDPRQKTIYHLHIEIEQTYHENASNHRTTTYPMSDEELHQEQLYATCRQYFDKVQKEIDDHLIVVEEFCQKTMVNKKGKGSELLQSQSSTNSSRKKINQPGSVGTTKRLTKATPSCVKRQTPKAALKNVSRPRNRFAHEKQNNEQAAMMKANSSNAKPSNPAKDNVLLNREATIADLQHLFNNGYFKTTNVSQFALALAHALTQVGQVLPTTTKQAPTNSSSTHSLSEHIALSSNGSAADKNNDLILKQLLKSINSPQTLNDSQSSSTNHSQWLPTTSTMIAQTEAVSIGKLVDDLKTNGHSSHSYVTYNGTLTPLPRTTNDISTTPPKKPCIPQMDGTIDEEEDDCLRTSATVMDFLIEQIIVQSDAERSRADSDYSMDLSEYVNGPSLIGMTPISPTHRSHLADPEKKKPKTSEKLIRLYQQWANAVFGRVKFTITNDEGYHVVSEDLDEAWSTIIQVIRTSRDDLNLAHLPMNNEELNGHRIFGLTKPIVHTMLNQMYTNSSARKPPPTTPLILPISSPSLSSTSSTAAYPTELINKKSLLSSSAKTNLYERKTRERQRFGWLMNYSRKIEYALRSFEPDEAFVHARRILLEEASVSLRLYHLHHFSERALLVGSSPIHGCGLFTLVDLVEGQMIVEYTGEVVRPCLTDKRERENEGKGFGCYMFTVDSMNVIDATHRGNKARFINHNCSPNCFAKTVLSGGAKHIVIYALIDIARGSELTYDYSFPEEDVKIPCHCGTSKCRIYLN